MGGFGRPKRCRTIGAGQDQGRAAMTDLERTVLYDLHVSLGGKMVPFAGYEMPVQYPMGVLKEHLHTRASAGLFDVSHMGQILVTAKSGRIEDAALALERLVPVDILGLKEGRQRYAMFTSAAGGILDDLMVANRGDHLFLVVNAACKAADLAHLKAGLPDCDVGMVGGRALVALQGPKAEAALARLVPDVVDLTFMDVAIRSWDTAELWISRSGYTGEDGFEISCAADHAEDLAKALLAEPDVMPAGLGARDTLRLEAGLCLWGNDIDETTTPVEAGLSWAISPRRRREGGFPGDSVILGQLQDGPSRRRVGICLQGRAPARSGCPILDTDGSPIGTVTSGGYAPSVGGPVAMGYVNATHAAPDTPLQLVVRGKPLAGTVVRLPFIEHRYVR